MKGVVFDLDGVITDTAKFHFEAWSQLAKEKFDLTLPAEFESKLKGISRIESLERILEFGNLSDKYTSDQVAEMANEKNTYYVAAIDSQLTENDILPGVKRLLDELKEHDMKLAIASASKNALHILEKLGIIDEFDAIADPAKVAKGKPAPDIFIAGAEAINLDPKDCVGVEDAVAGVAAIKSAGMVAVAVGDKDELSQADEVVPSTQDFSYELFNQVWNKVNK